MKTNLNVLSAIYILLMYALDECNYAVLHIYLCTFCFIVLVQIIETFNRLSSFTLWKLAMLYFTATVIVSNIFYAATLVVSRMTLE